VRVCDCAASQVFETTPHGRPDIPITYWAKFLFSDEYLTRINPNLALNIYTAVANPITNDGRTKITRGCLQHRDLRGGLAPDFAPKVKLRRGGVPDYEPASSAAVAAAAAEEESLRPVGVPVIVLQSTEDALVNASNVDAFLVGRTAKHLWSHQQNVVSAGALSAASDPTGQWVGKLSKSPEDYAKFSLLGKSGLRMLLESVQNPRGAFVMWSRSGHAVLQENKTVVLDLLDALCCPTAEYFGISTPQQDRARFNAANSTASLSSRDLPAGDDALESEVLFKLSPPKRRQGPSSTEPAEAAVDKDDTLEQEQTPPPPDRPSGAMEGTKADDEPPLQASPRPATAASVNEEEQEPQSRAQVLPRQQAPRPELPAMTPIRAPRTELPSPRDISGGAGAGITVEEQEPNSISSGGGGGGAHALIPPEAVSTREQRMKKKWADVVPTASSSADLERELELRHQELLAKEVALKDAQAAEASARIARIQQEQASRRAAYETEDKELLRKLEADLEARRAERAYAEKQRKVELNAVEQQLVAEGLVEAYVPPEGSSGPVPEIQPQMYQKPPELPALMREAKDPSSTLDQLVVDAEIARKKGIMSMEEFETVKKQLALNQLEREQRLRNREEAEELAFYNETAVKIQRLARGIMGRNRAREAKQVRDTKLTVERGVVQFQAVARGIRGRRRARHLKKLKLQNQLVGKSVVKIQCQMRAHLSRRYVHGLRRQKAARAVQRVFRGHLGRQVVRRERNRLELIRRKRLAASKIQSVWRMKVAKEEFRSLRIHSLAVVEIQRCFRGHLGRKKIQRRKQWEAAAPGPERIKLGLKLIEESKVAFERQQEEIDALHRAQERAEARVSHIHAELKDSEKELVILERELQEIDQIERDLQNLTHERDLITRGIKDAAGLSKLAGDGNSEAVLGRPPGVGVADMTPEQQRKLKAEAYALEMTIQIKRAEREKKRQELESEFATVFHDVEKKKKALERLEASLVDMESTRERKDREFRRLQQNLMQLLLEQKLELDSLREKGIELETATATSAAAATATALKAKEHEKRSAAMFSQTEELMKFQFMSMSLSYFSSLNMLKQLRDMNADTTSAAVTSSAEAAAAAATSAIAANLPNIKKLDLNAGDYVKLSAKKKKEELAVRPRRAFRVFAFLRTFLRQMCFLHRRRSRKRRPK
jgi:hypothetical protein